MAKEQGEVAELGQVPQASVQDLGNGIETLRVEDRARGHITEWSSKRKGRNRESIVFTRLRYLNLYIDVFFQEKHVTSIFDRILEGPILYLVKLALLPVTAH